MPPRKGRCGQTMAKPQQISDPSQKGIPLTNHGISWQGGMTGLTLSRSPTLPPSLPFSSDVHWRTVLDCHHRRSGPRSNAMFQSAGSMPNLRHPFLPPCCMLSSRFPFTTVICPCKQAPPRLSLTGSFIDHFVVVVKV